MSDIQQPAEPAAPVSVTLNLPSGLVEAYDALVDARIYPDRESAMLHGLVESWRYHKASFHKIRLGFWADEQDREAEAPTDEDTADEDAPDGPES